MDAAELTKLVSDMRHRRMPYARISEELKSHGVNMAPGNLWRWYQRQLKILRQLDAERKLIEVSQTKLTSRKRTEEKHKLRDSQTESGWGALAKADKSQLLD